ncbi:hypothetical protein ACS0TY_013984 [Phlomoides rotata]
MAGDRETSQQSVGKRRKGLISMSTPPINPGSTTAPISPINPGSMASPTVGGMAGPTLSSNPGSTTFPTMGGRERLTWDQHLYPRNHLKGMEGMRHVENSHTLGGVPEGVVSDKLYALKKEVEMMRQQINNNGGVLPVTGCHFSEEILQDELLYNFKPVNYEYDGTTTLNEHLVRFENLVFLHRYAEGVKCMVFSQRHWRKQHNSGSAALEVLSASAEVKVNALTNGLRDGDLFSSLAKNPIQTFDELLHKAEKYITLEEVRKTRKSEVRSLPYDK